MKKIKVIVETSTTHLNFLYIHPLLYMLKTYHDNFGKSKNEYEWIRYEQDLSYKKNINIIADELINENIDIFCFSVYCWNNIFLTQLSKKIKLLKPNSIIIMGGPDIMARTEEDWFIKNSHVDYVVYGDGEKAFSLLLDYLAGFIKNVETIPNLIYQKDGKKIINKYETLRDKNYFAISPWKHCLNIFEKDIEYSIKNGKKVWILWERVRGCPYSCSFCDWSSGLHHKISKKTYDFRTDIDLIYEICQKFKVRVNLYIIDANIGMFEEDYEIFKYIFENNKNSVLFFDTFIFLNWSKNHKERVYKIWNLIFKSLKNINLRISQQDVNDLVLKNIDRPSIPWNDIKHYVYSNKEIFKQSFSTPPIVELIMGLPGQTKETWYNNLIESARIGLFYVGVHEWSLLPYSPASDINYQKKFDIKYSKIYMPQIEFRSKNKERSLILNKIIEKENNIFNSTKGKNIFSFYMVTETYSYNFEDLLFFNLSTSFYNKIILYYRNIIKDCWDKKIINKVEEILFNYKLELEKTARKHHKIFKEDLDKYNCILFSICDKDGVYFNYRDWFAFDYLDLEGIINVTERQYSSVSQAQDCA